VYNTKVCALKGHKRKVSKMIEIAEKVSIINTLIQEDRNEIRLNKELILRSSYFIISGLIAIGAFSMAQNNDQLDLALLSGIWSLFVLYFVCFVFLKQHLLDLRLMLDSREIYYKNLSLLESEIPFNPLQGIRKGAKPTFHHKYFWFFPIMAFLVAIFNSLIILRI
jgi:hypothetical protein